MINRFKELFHRWLPQEKIGRFGDYLPVLERKRAALRQALTNSVQGGWSISFDPETALCHGAAAYRPIVHEGKPSGRYQQRGPEGWAPINGKHLASILGSGAFGQLQRLSADLIRFEELGAAMAELSGLIEQVQQEMHARAEAVRAAASPAEAMDALQTFRTFVHENQDVLPTSALREISLAERQCREQGLLAPDPVAEVEATRGRPEGVTLFWSPAAGASSYRIYATDGPDPSGMADAFVGQVSAPATQFLHADAPPDQDRYYWVVAENMAGKAAPNPTPAPGNRTKPDPNALRAPAGPQLRAEPVRTSTAPVLSPDLRRRADVLMAEGDVESLFALIAECPNEASLLVPFLKRGIDRQLDLWHDAGVSSLSEADHDDILRRHRALDQRVGEASLDPSLSDAVRRSCERWLERIEESKRAALRQRASLKMRITDAEQKVLRLTTGDDPTAPEALERLIATEEKLLKANPEIKSAFCAALDRIRERFQIRHPLPIAAKENAETVAPAAEVPDPSKNRAPAESIAANEARIPPSSREKEALSEIAGEKDSPDSPVEKRRSLAEVDASEKKLSEIKSLSDLEPSAVSARAVAGNERVQEALLEQRDVQHEPHVPLGAVRTPLSGARAQVPSVINCPENLKETQVPEPQEAADGGSNSEAVARLLDEIRKVERGGVAGVRRRLLAAAKENRGFSSAASDLEDKLQQVERCLDFEVMLRRKISEVRQSSDAEALKPLMENARSLFELRPELRRQLEADVEQVRREVLEKEAAFERAASEIEALATSAARWDDLREARARFQKLPAMHPQRTDWAARGWILDQLIEETGKRLQHQVELDQEAFSKAEKSESFSLRPLTLILFGTLAGLLAGSAAIPRLRTDAFASVSWIFQEVRGKAGQGFEVARTEAQPSAVEAFPAATDRTDHLNPPPQTPSPERQEAPLRTETRPATRSVGENGSVVPTPSADHAQRGRNPSTNSPSTAEPVDHAGEQAFQQVLEAIRAVQRKEDLLVLDRQRIQGFLLRNPTRNEEMDRAIRNKIEEIERTEGVVGRFRSAIREAKTASDALRIREDIDRDTTLGRDQQIQLRSEVIRRYRELEVVERAVLNQELDAEAIELDKQLEALEKEKSDIPLFGARRRAFVERVKALRIEYQDIQRMTNSRNDRLRKLGG